MISIDGITSQSAIVVCYYFFFYSLMTRGRRIESIEIISVHVKDPYATWDKRRFQFSPLLFFLFFCAVLHQHSSLYSSIQYSMAIDDRFISFK